MSRHHLMSSARWIGLATLLSRITGMVRDMALVQFFGATWVSDAFNYAFQFPNLFRRLFAEGAMASVFVPTFSATLEKEGRPAAWQLLARTLALLTVTITAVLMAVEVIILALWWLLPVGDAAGINTAGAAGAVDQTAAARHLILWLTALMFPFLLSVSVLSLFTSILNCLGSFFMPAIMPLVVNVVMWVGIVFGAPALSRTQPDVQIYAVAISVLAAGALQLVLLAPALRAHHIPIRWEMHRRDPTVRRMLRLMAPVIVGQGALLIGVFLDQQVCVHLTHLEAQPDTGALLGVTFRYPLEEGALTVLTIAQRMYQFPLGVLAISLATAALPVLSRLAARGEWDHWGDEMRASLRLALFVGLLTGGMLIVLDVPIIRLLFEYKKFEAADTDRAARALTWYGAGMWAFCAQHIVLRGFYSVSDVKTPLILSCVLLPLNLVMSIALVWLEPIREAAFGISTSLTSALNVLIGLAILQRRLHRPLADAGFLWSCALMLLAALAAGVAMWAARTPIDQLASVLEGMTSSWTHLIPPSKTALIGQVLARCVQVFVPLAIGSAVYLALSWRLGLPEIHVVLPHRKPPPASPPA